MLCPLEEWEKNDKEELGRARMNQPDRGREERLFTSVPPPPPALTLSILDNLTLAHSQVTHLLNFNPLVL